MIKLLIPPDTLTGRTASGCGLLLIQSCEACLRSAVIAIALDADSGAEVMLGISALTPVHRSRYGTDRPLDVAAHYDLLRMPIDICAGRSDGIISRDNVRMHFDAMMKGGCNATFNEFNLGHLDFTFAGAVTSLLLDHKCVPRLAGKL